MRGPSAKYTPRQEVPDGGITTAVDWTTGRTTAGTADFNTDNATVLQIYICASYPCIEPSEANKLMDEVMHETAWLGRGLYRHGREPNPRRSWRG